MGREATRARTQRRRHPAPVGDLNERCGELLRAARERAGITQAELGAPYYTRYYVSAVEGGRTGVSLKALAHFSDRLGISLRQLVPN